MNIARNHVEAVMGSGYTEPEARFLYTVATHSGYFILRQFLAFTAARRGKRSSIFARKVLNYGHATVRDYLGYGSIYHLFSRTLYGQIEKENLRNRRIHSFEFIRTRLVLLDFVIRNREVQYLETESDKINFFSENLGVPKDSLPAKVYEGGIGSQPTIRYFVDKFPLFLATLPSDVAPVVTFSYVDSGSETLAGFQTHLAAYTPLFEQLRRFRFLYISPRDTEFEKATEIFRRMVDAPLDGDLTADLFRYFDVRKRFESRQYIVPVTEDFEFLNAARRRFDGEGFEEMYKAWSVGALGEDAVRLQYSNGRIVRQIRFETYLVNQHRSHFDRNENGKVNVA